MQFANLEGAKWSVALRRLAVVVEEIPLALILHDAVMGGPSLDRSEDDALVNEWSIRLIAYSVAKEVGITR